MVFASYLQSFAWIVFEQRGQVSKEAVVLSWWESMTE